MFTTKTSEADVSKFPVVDSLNEFSKVLTDYGTALSDFSCFTKELMDPVVLPEGKTVLDVFKVCFDDGTSLMEEYHRDRKDTDQKWELWRPALTGSPPFSGQRLFTCTTIIRALVAKSCPFTEYQRYAFMNVGGREPTLVVQFSGQASGVMFADAFRAEALLVFAQNDSKLTMRAFGYIQFLRDVWVKGKILRTSIDNEMPECYRGLSSMLTERLQNGTASSNSEVAEKHEEILLPVQNNRTSVKEEASVSHVVWKPFIYGEFFLEIICAIFCLNALFRTYFFTISSTVFRMNSAALPSILNNASIPDANQLKDFDLVTFLLVRMVRPLLISCSIWLFYIVISLLRKTVSHMKE
ncbi:VASt domain [Trypanosoma melophagium]|uniref:VASt domain n=1 Tax=Trypanosoma melophagium TaxID=715481 RepID=UPI00351A1359|nr:VASt domain [Trypanosoma melophagium]